MPNSAQLYKEIQGIMDTYKGYTPVNMGDVTADMMNRVDNFRPQYQELANWEADAYATPAAAMNDYYKAYGTGAANAGNGVGAMNRMQSILQTIGRKNGTAQVLGNVIDTQKGRIGDIAKSAFDQYNAQRDAQMQMYQMKMPLWQAALNSEEQAKARAAQLQAARMQMQSYGGAGSQGGAQGDPQYNITGNGQGNNGAGGFANFITNNKYTGQNSNMANTGGAVINKVINSGAYNRANDIANKLKIPLNPLNRFGNLIKNGRLF